MDGRAINLTLSVVVVLITATACTLGEVGGADVCTQAAQHVASCTGGAALQVEVASCSADAAARADQVLQMSCDQMGSANERSAMFFQGLLCQLMPFLCNTNNPNPGPQPGQPGPQPGPPGQPGPQPGQAGPVAPGTFRINDCFQLPGKGWCYDMVKPGPSDACTELMEQHEWQQPHFAHSQCLQPNGNRCRLARVCQQFQHKGECINAVPHHNDVPVCQAGQNPGPQPQGPQCNSDADCNGQLCYEDHTCAPHHSKPAGASCKDVQGAFVAAFCQAGLSCHVSFQNGQASSVCTLAP